MPPRKTPIRGSCAIKPYRRTAEKPLPKKVDPRDLDYGTKHEMEHTKDKAVARRIALDHLEEHPTYYRYLPVAEQMMTIQENKRMPVRKKKRRKPAARMLQPWDWQALPPNWR